MDPGSMEIYSKEIEYRYELISENVHFFICEHEFPIDLKMFLISEMICFFENYFPLDSRIGTLRVIESSLTLKHFATELLG